MTLYTPCNSCEKEIKVKSSASDRPDLAMEKGEEFEVRCNDCRTRKVIHVNEVKAKVSYLIILIGVGVGLLATVILWKMLGAIATISMSIPILFWNQQASAVNAFNSYRI